MLLGLVFQNSLERVFKRIGGQSKEVSGSYVCVVQSDDLHNPAATCDVAPHGDDPFSLGLRCPWSLAHRASRLRAVSVMCILVSSVTGMCRFKCLNSRMFKKQIGSKFSSSGLMVILFSMFIIRLVSLEEALVTWPLTQEPGGRGWTGSLQTSAPGLTPTSLLMLTAF